MNNPPQEIEANLRTPDIGLLLEDTIGVIGNAISVGASIGVGPLRVGLLPAAMLEFFRFDLNTNRFGAKIGDYVAKTVGKLADKASGLKDNERLPPEYELLLRVVRGDQIPTDYYPESVNQALLNLGAGLVPMTKKQTPNGPVIQAALDHESLERAKAKLPGIAKFPIDLYESFGGLLLSEKEKQAFMKEPADLAGKEIVGEVQAQKSFTARMGAQGAMMLASQPTRLVTTAASGITLVGLGASVANLLAQGPSPEALLGVAGAYLAWSAASVLGGACLVIRDGVFGKLFLKAQDRAAEIGVETLMTKTTDQAFRDLSSSAGKLGQDVGAFVQEAIKAPQKIYEGLHQAAEQIGRSLGIVPQPSYAAMQRDALALE